MGAHVMLNMLETHLSGVEVGVNSGHGFAFCE